MGSYVYVGPPLNFTDNSSKDIPLNNSFFY